jgi:DNA-binding CsgD family transcriptional regulator
MADTALSDGAGSVDGRGSHEDAAVIAPEVAEAVRRLTALLGTVRPVAVGPGLVLLLDVTIDDVRCLVTRAQPAGVAPLSLSPREWEIARMVTKGHTDKSIAHVLDISVWTVSSHIRRIFAKLGVTNRAAMVGRLLEHGVDGAMLPPAFAGDHGVLPTEPEAVAQVATGSGATAPSARR